MQGLQFNPRGFDAVIVPYVPLDDLETRTRQAEQRLADAQRYTYLGPHLFEKRPFNFRTTSVVLANEADTAEGDTAEGDTAEGDTTKVHSSDADIGYAWIRKDANIDPATGRIHNPVLGNPNVGERTYYPQNKNELRHVAQNQFSDADLQARRFGRLVPSDKEDVIRYLIAPPVECAFTYSINNRKERRMGAPVMALKNTSRLFNAEVNRALLRHNIYMFCDPQQLLVFFGNLIPGRTLLDSWPPIVKHVIINVKLNDADQWYLRSVKHTTIVPLTAAKSIRPASPFAVQRTSTYRSDVLVPNPTLSQNSHSASPPILSDMQYRQARDSAASSTEQLFDKHPTMSSSPTQPPSETDGKVNEYDMCQWLETLKANVFGAAFDRGVFLHDTRPPNYISIREYLLGPDDPPNTRSDGYRVSFASLRTPPDPASPLQMTAEDVGYLRMLNEVPHRAAWIEGIKLLLNTFKVERLDLVYDDRTTDGWKYVDNGDYMLIGEEMAADAVKCFLKPQVDEVVDFFLDVF